MVIHQLQTITHSIQMTWRDRKMGGITAASHRRAPLDGRLTGGSWA